MRPQVLSRHLPRNVSLARSFSFKFVVASSSFFLLCSLSCRLSSFYFFNSYLLSPVPVVGNGYFDSNVLSGQHAEVSEDCGKVSYLVIDVLI